MSATVLGPKEFERLMERERVMLRTPGMWSENWGPMAENIDRVARNRLMAQKIYERADYGPLADVRELVALRLAPWLRARL